ncbi:MAG: metalloregulator ArsR/SmtB family transcription factor [Rhizobiaceae bacterium]|nr:metalloregulator ArsR/SmtB family transcription factor [Rhizobiaceae bacterium]MCV0407765.1 metalloregulator ArsR/SmtB family transcription factor [Rhizobiaceae bacterium]
MQTTSRLLDESGRITGILSLLGNKKRFQIMCHLLDGELSVGVIAEKVELSQSALSQHLAKLRSLRLVETRRDRQTIYYSCASQEVRQLLECCETIFFGAEAQPPRLKAVSGGR